MNRVLGQRGDESLGWTSRFAVKKQKRRLALFLVIISTEIVTRDAGAKFSRKSTEEFFQEKAVICFIYPWKFLLWQSLLWSWPDWVKRNYFVQSSTHLGITSTQTHAKIFIFLLPNVKFTQKMILKTFHNRIY